MTQTVKEHQAELDRIELIAQRMIESGHPIAEQVWDAAFMVAGLAVSMEILKLGTQEVLPPGRVGSMMDHFRSMLDDLRSRVRDRANPSMPGTGMPSPRE